MKKYKDEKVTVMDNKDKKETIYKSELLEKIRQDFKTMEKESKDISPGFFTEDDVFSFYDFLLMRHRDEWTVIDDMEDGNEGNEGNDGGQGK